MSYPTEELSERNRWQDEYDAETREHARTREMYAEMDWLHHEEEREAYDVAVPAEIAAELADDEW